MAEFDEFRAYARLAPDDDLIAARTCYDAAVQAAEDAGVRVELMAGNRKLDLYLYSLALHYYENRGFVPVYQAYAVSEYTHVMQRKMRMELKYSRQNRERQDDGWLM